MLPDALIVCASRGPRAAEPRVQEGLATALERSKAYREAGVLWQALADKAAERNDRVLAREVRTHVVTLWSLEHTIDRQIPRLETGFNAEPPDVEAGGRSRRSSSTRDGSRRPRRPSAA